MNKSYPSQDNGIPAQFDHSLDLANLRTSGWNSLQGITSLKWSRSEPYSRNSTQAITPGLLLGRDKPFSATANQKKVMKPKLIPNLLFTRKLVLNLPSYLKGNDLQADSSICGRWQRKGSSMLCQDQELEASPIGGTSHSLHNPSMHWNVFMVSVSVIKCFSALAILTRKFVIET